MSSDTDAALERWHEAEALAEEMVPLVGALYRNRDVITRVYGRSLVRSCSSTSLGPGCCREASSPGRVAPAPSGPT